MVQLTSLRLGVKKTFGLTHKFKNYNHRVPLKYQKFQEKLNPEAILSHYSRDDIDELNPRVGERTYKDAQESIAKKDFLLPNLLPQDLETNKIFQDELNRQRAIIARIEKIRVVVDTVPGKDSELVMNRHISTPFDCARHIHELLTTQSVVAQVVNESSQGDELLNKSGVASNDGNQTADSKHKPTNGIYWDMHRPLVDNCRIRFRHFAEQDVSEVNKIYWRSCSFVMGMAIRMAFKDQVRVLLHSWPKPSIKSGSFVYDVALNLSDKWIPSEQELRAFTKVMWRIKEASLPFDRLQVDRDVAMKLFATNPLKLAQIDSILENSPNNNITVYRCGGLLDLSVGPMISNTNQIGRITLAAVHPFETDSEAFKGVFHRFQGVSLPQQLPISSYLYQNVIINHAKSLNKVAL